MCSHGYKFAMKTTFPLSHAFEVFTIGYSENKSIAQYFLLVNEAQVAVLVPRPPADLKQLTESSGEFVSLMQV